MADLSIVKGLGSSKKAPPEARRAYWRERYRLVGARRTPEGLEKRRESDRIYHQRRSKVVKRIKQVGMSARRRGNMEFIRSLRANPCMDCGGTFPVICMDFDHRDPSQKSFELSRSRALSKEGEVVGRGSEVRSGVLELPSNQNRATQD